jgi:DMSO/TMAO reductase YedYZ heme-binding membrane subunit
MKQYIQTIAFVQKALLGAGILILMILPLALLFYPDFVWAHTSVLYDIAHISVFLVMIVRPLADIMKSTKLIRPLVILRKGLGVLSASVVVSFMLAKLIANPVGYIRAYSTLAYWSPTHGALFAHLADVTAVILLITSNVFSKRIMGVWWKRVQRLSYVYFYASSLYVFTSFGSIDVLAYMMIVTIVTLIAFILNNTKTPVPVTPTTI